MIFCEACGVVNETAYALLADTRETIEGLERDLRTKRAAISRLERSKAERLQTSKHRESALVVLRHWKETCMPNAREIDSEDRLGNVLARLAGGATVDELKRCADGYAKRPYVVKGGRSAHGKPTERHIDAELIYRTPKHVQAGLALAEQGDSTEPDPTEWEKIDWRRVRRANHRVILRALTELSGKPYHDETMRSHHTECPRCGGALTIFDPDVSESLLSCTGCSIDEATFFRALREDDGATQRAVETLVGGR